MNTPDSFKRFSLLTDFAIRFDKYGAIQQASELFSLLLGFFDNLQGQPVEQFIRTEDLPVFQNARDLAMLTGNKQSFVCCLLNPRALPIWMDCRLYYFQENEEYIFVGFDVSQWKEKEAELRHLSTQDPLTGLPSRKLLDESISTFMEVAVRENKWLAIFVIHLDGYKNVNDSLGYEIGNKLIYSVAERLQTLDLPNRELISMAVNQFVLIVPVNEDGRVKEVEAISRKIHPLLMRPFKVAEHTLHIGSNIGISFYPEHGVTSSKLLKHAEIAMYNAKNQGKNNWEIYNHDLNKTETKNLAILESAMHEGLLNGEFIVVYQPVFCIKTGALRGAEALMRWCHPEQGWVSPAKFIPLAERSGLIDILGAWSLRTACRQAKVWQAAGKPDFYISVNVSPSQFRKADFTGLINRTLIESELAPSSLMLEITEGVLMQDPESSNAILSGLRESGVKIAIDDFGTGYSSLSYLKKFPLSVLKIDKSFVDHVPADIKDTAIVSAVMDLAAGLGLVVVAEGVEIQEQLDYLKLKNCDLVQGYLTGKPMNSVEFAEKLI